MGIGGDEDEDEGVDEDEDEDEAEELELKREEASIVGIIERRRRRTFETEQ